jgi:hypothetical protein
MPVGKLNVVFCALIVNRISYCLSAWGGFLNAEQIGRINALFLRARKYRLTDNIYDFVGLLQHLDYKLFKSIQSGIHCLKRILPQKKFDNQRLRIKGHNYCLPKCLFELYKKSFYRGPCMPFCSNVVFVFNIISHYYNVCFIIH